MPFMLPRSRLTELAENMVRHPNVLNYQSLPPRVPFSEHIEDVIFRLGGKTAALLLAAAVMIAILSLGQRGWRLLILQYLIYCLCVVAAWIRRLEGPSRW